MHRSLKWLYLLVPCIIMVAFVLRIWRLDTVPLRGDEAFTAIHWTNPPFSERWLFFLEYEPNPASMVVYWAWSLGAGISEFGLRYFSVLANTLGVAVMIALARRLFARWDVALSAGVLWAVHPFLIWHAQDARQYGLYVTLAVLNIYLLHRALHEKKPRWWLYILSQTFTLYLYYFEFFMVIVQMLYVLVMHRKQLGRFLRTWIIIGVMLIPLAIQTYIVLFGRDYVGTATSADFGALFTEFIPTLWWGGSLDEVWMGVALMLGLIVITWFMPSFLLLAWLVIPLSVLFILSHITAVFLPRYVIAVAPVFILIIVSAITVTFKRRFAIGDIVITSEDKMRGYVVVGFIAILSLSQVYAYFYTDPPKSFDWRGLMALVEARSSADDLIINDTSDTALEYYHRGDINIFFIPEDNPPIDSYLPTLLDEHRSIFLLNGARTGDVQAYLRSNAQRLPISWNGLEQFRKWDVDISEIETTTDIQIGDVARLIGYSWLGDDVVLLYWEALRQTDAPLNILTHFSTELNAPPVAVSDHQIAEGQISTQTWQIGTIYRDPIVIPALPNGDILLLIGMYDTTPPYTRLPITQGGIDEDGRVILLTIRR
ncbi:MAG: glycosyltransferase family 39 protein [Anaerolineae bacterium]|nr:glycosyltransferase family 39 protein [Anaerolineae bacterium]